MNNQNEWWFDGEYSECYFAWGHAPKVEFACWVETQEDESSTPVLVECIEHLWAADINEERFEMVSQDTFGAKPITRFRP
jgi:hypothetical protein